MPGKTKETMEIREMLRRFQQGQSNRSIARDLRINRKIVDRYRTWADEQGLLEEALPSLGDLHQLLEGTLNHASPPQNTSTVEPYRDLVEKLMKEGLEIAATHERPKERGYTGSYASVYRFVCNLKPCDLDVTVRVETRPGEEAQVGFGYAGKMIDPETGELRKTWAFVMTLSWGRFPFWLRRPLSPLSSPLPFPSTQSASHAPSLSPAGPSTTSTVTLLDPRPIHSIWR